mmetsp:Transcript_3014/g.5768  ORF Transcript_3014/g.5768 Transcript_3014/m.5768 type:complete len:298 (+) Transcript_3014:2269-3162(+)
MAHCVQCIPSRGRGGDPLHVQRPRRRQRRSACDCALCLTATHVTSRPPKRRRSGAAMPHRRCSGGFGPSPLFASHGLRSSGIGSGSRRGGRRMRPRSRRSGQSLAPLLTRRWRKTGPTNSGWSMSRPATSNVCSAGCWPAAASRSCGGSCGSSRRRSTSATPRTFCRSGVIKRRRRSRPRLAGSWSARLLLCSLWRTRFGRRRRSGRCCCCRPWPAACATASACAGCARRCCSCRQPSAAPGPHTTAPRWRRRPPNATPSGPKTAWTMRRCAFSARGGGTGPCRSWRGAAQSGTGRS